MHKNFRVFDFLLILTFILSLYLPLLMTNNRDISIIEKRKLTKFPQVKWNHKIAIPITFPSQFEAFFNDHFGFRDHLAQLYYLYSFMLKSTSNPNVLIGQEGWLFYVKTADGNSLEDFRGNDSLLPEELWQWRAVLEAKYAWLKQSGVEYFFVIAPDKHSIYAEYFPARIRKVGKYSRLDQLLEYMKDSKVPIIDLRPPLLQAKNKELVYYKTDTHWNDFGVAVAQYTILQYFTKFNFAFHPIKFDVADFGLVQYSGDLAQMLNLSSALKEMAPHLSKPLPLCDNQTLEKNLKYPLRSTFITECCNNAPKALIFRDSFFVALEPFISQYFSKSLYVWSYPNFSQFEQYVKLHSSDIVIEERIERLLGKVPTLPTPQNETYNVFLENWWETGKIVYQLAGSQQDKLTGRHQLAIISAEKGYKLMSLGNDPFFHLSEFKMDGAMLHIMRIELTVPEATVWQVFYPETKRKPKYHKENSISGRLQKGDNTIYVLIDGKNLQGQIRIDPGAIAGEYFLKTIEVRAVDSL